ncbi:hypothetical protein GQR58_030352 [Nymphon striatum]|nr:hypothetical protein GQR58_030352 [Nymphon striatum]
MFRCARGSTSLESFHLHINRFIPVIVFNSPPQLSAAMTGLGAPGPRSYNLRMHHALRKMSIEVLGAILRRHTLRPVSRTPRAEPCTEPSYDAIPLRPLSRAERSYDAIPLRPVSRTPRAEPCTELVTYDAIPLRPLSRAERYYDATPQLPPLLSLPVSHTPRHSHEKAAGEGCPWPGFVAVKTTYGSFKSPTTSQGPSDSSTTGHQRGGAAPVFASAKHCGLAKTKARQQLVKIMPRPTSSFLVPAAPLPMFLCSAGSSLVAPNVLPNMPYAKSTFIYRKKKGCPSGRMTASLRRVSAGRVAKRSVKGTELISVPLLSSDCHTVCGRLDAMQKVIRENKKKDP